MQTNQIPVITVSYNSPDLIEALLRTFRQFYSNKVYVIDGSRPEVATQIGAIAAHGKFEGRPVTVDPGPGRIGRLRGGGKGKKTERDGQRESITKHRRLHKDQALAEPRSK